MANPPTYFEFPRIKCIRQTVRAPKLREVKDTLETELERFNFSSYIDKDDRVALTGSSRGIQHQDLILKTLVTHIKNAGGRPFIFPAMGSHGGGTVAGQTQILKDYGITEEKMGCPIKASMDVVEIGKSVYDTPIYADQMAVEADKIVLVNRIKTHSKFVGKVESGLSKMCLIGLGKHKGAKLYHRLIAKYGWPEIINSHRKIILEELPIILGVGVILNTNGEVAQIHTLQPQDFSQKEPALLKTSKELATTIPFKDVDLLIVDEMGKNIFGTGMDTTVTCRKKGSKGRVGWLFVRDLTEQTHGNAQGIGLADFTTKRLVNKIDYEQMYLNALTAYRTDSPKIPIYKKNDKQTLETIVDLAGLSDISKLKVVWIKNTLQLEKMLVSESYLEKVKQRKDLTPLEESYTRISFDDEGFLTTSENYW